MSFFSSILLSLVKSEQVYVILGGSSATNNNTFFNYTSTNGVYSYNFKNNEWDISQNPMPGGEGNGSSIWPILGDFLFQDNSSVYFYDCARLGANIEDWGVGGKYYNLANNCLSKATKFIKGEDYNILWQEGPQDNYYSYDSNYYTDTMNHLISKSGINSNWFISIYTYGDINSSYRNSKLEDILILTNLNNNVYLGANLDKTCIGYSPFSELEIQTIAEEWYQSIISKSKTNFVFNIFYECIAGFTFSGLLFYFAIFFIGLSFFCGSIYAARYYQRRKYYLRLQNN
jgi:hypothetical protein